MRDLASYGYNTHSQRGEDGSSRSCCAGSTSNAAGAWSSAAAWDGCHLSNTYRLVELSWQAVLIEGDPDRFRDLEAKAASFPGVHRLKPARGLRPTGRPRHSAGHHAAAAELDLLSIDIDGADLHVWRSVRRYRPMERHAAQRGSSQDAAAAPARVPARPVAARRSPAALVAAAVRVAAVNGDSRTSLARQ